MKSTLLILSCFFFANITAQTICDTLAPVPEVFDLSEMTDSTRFMPAFPHGSPDTYTFEIHDKWGEKIFSTDIPSQGWNGLRNNRKGTITEGAYMWIMNCTWTLDSTSISCNGFVNCKNTGAPVKVIALDTLQCHPTIWVPNTFTPNGDGPNDVFIPMFGCPPVDYELQIFDRWGNLIFQTTDVKKGWDGNGKGGSSAQIDTYLWRIKCVFYEGDKKRQHIGHVTLIR